MEKYFDLSILNLVTVEKLRNYFELRTLISLLAVQCCWSTSHAQCMVMFAGIYIINLPYMLETSGYDHACSPIEWWYEVV